MSSTFYLQVFFNMGDLKNLPTPSAMEEVLCALSIQHSTTLNATALISRRSTVSLLHSLPLPCPTHGCSGADLTVIAFIVNDGLLA